MSYKLVLENEVLVTKNNLQTIFETKEVFVFGYGSLLYSNGWSRRGMHRAPTEKDLIECSVVGYERGTFGLYNEPNLGIRNDFCGLHFYGVIPNSEASLNGVLVKIHSFDDWVALMYTECIAGITVNYNYRCVDVTDKIRDIKLKENQVVHMVVNEELNKEKWRSFYPAPEYYKKVTSGVKKERSINFQRTFFKTGGLTSQQVKTLYKSAKLFKW